MVDRLTDTYSHVGFLLTKEIFVGLPLGQHYGAIFDSEVVYKFNPTHLLSPNISVEFASFDLMMHVEKESQSFFFIDLRQDEHKVPYCVADIFRIWSDLDDKAVDLQQRLTKMVFFNFRDMRDRHRGELHRLVEHLYAIHTTKRVPVRFYLRENWFKLSYYSGAGSNVTYGDDEKERRYELMVSAYSDHVTVLDCLTDVTIDQTDLVDWV